ncbi:phosphatidate cytidylyltransferase [Clostridium sp. CAG:762]|nr:phosphatidate cytidylyltransferase [Clostridium sp. CAG:762]
MKKRVVSAFLMILIFALCIIISSKIFAILMLICGNLCLKELIDIKYKNKYIDFVKFVCYLSISILILNGVFFKFNTLFTLIFPILSIITPIIFYNDNKKYNMEDSLYLIGITFFLGIAFNIIVYLREIDIALCLYIFLVACLTDTYAYIGGSLIGRHKLTEISPKKTIEGSILGSFMGTILASIYYLTVIDANNIFKVLLMTFILTVLSEFGDLVFSSIKRHFKIKDYSNIIPGHGGMLDRFDSIIYVALSYVLVLTIM